MPNPVPPGSEQPDPKAPIAPADSENGAGEETRGSISVLKMTLQEFSDDDCTMMAASLSYYTVFSLPPLLFIIIFFAGLFVQQASVEQEVLGQVGALIGPSAVEQVRTMLVRTSEKTAGGGLSLLTSILVLLVAATGVFAQLQTALNRAWGVMPDPKRGGIRSFLGKRILSLGMVLVIGFLLLVSLALSAFISAAGARLGNLLPSGISEGTFQLINSAISFGVFALLFAAIFKWLPDAVIRWRDVLVGAVGTATLFVLGKLAIGIYLGQSDVGEAYGAAGALAVIMLWVYYTSMILLLGAEFTQAWARWYGTRIEPEESAVRVVRRFEYVKPGATGSARKR